MKADNPIIAIRRSVIPKVLESKDQADLPKSLSYIQNVSLGARRVIQPQNTKLTRYRREYHPPPTPKREGDDETSASAELA